MDNPINILHTQYATQLLAEQSNAAQLKYYILYSF